MWRVKYLTPDGIQYRCYKVAEDWEVRRKTPKGWTIVSMTKEY